MSEQHVLILKDYHQIWDLHTYDPGLLTKGRRKYYLILYNPNAKVRYEPLARMKQREFKLLCKVGLQVTT